MCRLTKRECRTNERLEAALEAGEANPEDFFDGYTLRPRVRADFGAFLTPLDAAREVVSISQPQPNERVLDFCAGLGVFAYALLEASVPAGNVTAVELVDVLYEIGSRLVPEVDWLWANAFEKPFWERRMGSFDLVIGNPPWGRTVGREPWDKTYDQFGLFLVGGRNGRKSAVAEALSLEVALRCLRPGGRVVFLLPTNAFENSAWSRYEREMAPYEAGRQLAPIEVEFAKTAVQAQVVVVERNDRPFPGQEFKE